MLFGEEARHESYELSPLVEGECEALGKMSNRAVVWSSRKYSVFWARRGTREYYMRG